jgi:3-hydroxymyristoyl/3-hydroxydecanoyl-(acyl carrier protein) dehydratase
MKLPELPHAYPFRFVDAILTPPGEDFSEGQVSAAVTTNGRLTPGNDSGAGTALLAEAIAQAALLLQGGDPEVGRRGFLAGIDGFHVDRLPQPGDRLEIDVRLTARFGSIVKFEGEVRCGSETLARGGILVRQGVS